MPIQWNVMMHLIHVRVSVKHNRYCTLALPWAHLQPFRLRIWHKHESNNHKLTTIH
jgi:hypothetical protein